MEEKNLKLTSSSSWFMHILHLNFIKDTHKMSTQEINSFIEDYDKLSRQINKFINYVENNWKQTWNL